MDEIVEKQALEDLRKLIPDLPQVLASLAELGKTNPTLFNMALKFIRKN